MKYTTAQTFFLLENDWIGGSNWVFGKPKYILYLSLWKIK